MFLSIISHSMQLLWGLWSQRISSEVVAAYLTIPSQHFLEKQTFLWVEIVFFLPYFPYKIKASLWFHRVCMYVYVLPNNFLNRKTNIYETWYKWHIITVILVFKLFNSLLSIIRTWQPIKALWQEKTNSTEHRMLKFYVI